MIKIYSGDKEIYLIDDNKFMNYKEEDYCMYFKPDWTPKEVKETYCEVVNHDIHKSSKDKKPKENYFYGKNLDNLFRNFKSIFKIIEAGGGLVKNKKGKYLFIFRNGKWDLPKGKREQGETIETSALREVEEECGIKGLKIVKRLPTTYHIYSLNEKQILKPTVWFEMECDDTSELIPQTEEGITEVRWFTKTDLKIVKRNTYPSIKDVINGIQK